MKILLAFAFILFVVGIMVFFKITPDTISETITSYKRKKSLKSACSIKKEHQLITFAKNIMFALTTMGKRGSLYFIILLSIILIVAGFFLGLTYANVWLSISLSIILAATPFLFIRIQYIQYKILLMEEMETSLSTITSTVTRTENVVISIEENINDIRNPLYDIFNKFLFQVKHNVPINSAIDEMKKQINNVVFKEWCDALKGIANDRSLKMSLRPIVDRLTAIKLAQSEAQVMLNELNHDFNGVTILSTIIVFVICYLIPKVVAIWGIPIMIGNIAINMPQLCTTLFAVAILILFISFFKVFTMTKDIDFDKV